MLYLCDNQVLLKAVKRWVAERRKATLAGVPNAGIVLGAIKELRKRAIAGAATFLVKVHSRELANEDSTSKQTRLFQAKMFLRNGTTN